MAEKITGEELRYQLQSLGWSQSDLAGRLDVGRDTVCRWVNGKNPIPVYASEYIRLVLIIRNAARDI